MVPAGPSLGAAGRTTAADVAPSGAPSPATCGATRRGCAARAWRDVPRMLHTVETACTNGSSARPTGQSTASAPITSTCRSTRRDPPRLRLRRAGAVRDGYPCGPSRRCGWSLMRWRRSVRRCPTEAGGPPLPARTRRGRLLGTQGTPLGREVPSRARRRPALELPCCRRWLPPPSCVAGQ